MSPVTDITTVYLRVDNLARLAIGFSFLTISIEVTIIVASLGDMLLFRRTLSIFALFVGACGISRLLEAISTYLVIDQVVAAATKFDLLRAAYPYPWILMTAEIGTALSGLGAMVVLVPLVLNARGWRIRLDRL